MKNIFNRSPHYAIMALLIIVLFISLLIAVVYNHAKPKPAPLQVEYLTEKIDLESPFKSVSFPLQKINDELFFSLGKLNVMDSSYDGKHIITISDIALFAWETDGSKYRLTHWCPIHHEKILCVTFSPKGNALAVGTEKGNVLLWDTGTWKQRLALKPYKAQIPFLSFSPDEKILAIICSGGLIKFLDAQTGEEIHQIQIRSKMPLTRFVFSPDGNTLLVSFFQSTETYLCDVKSGEIIRKFFHTKTNPSTTAFSPDGQKVYFSEGDFSLSQVDTNSTQSTNQTNSFTGHTQEITTLDISPDGQRILTGSKDGSVKMWDTQTGQEIESILEPIETSNSLFERANIAKVINHIRFFPDGKHALIGMFEGTIEIYDLIQKKVLETLPGHHSETLQYAIAKDWNRLLMSYCDDSIKLVDLNTHKILYSVKDHSDFITDIVLSPDDSMFASLDRLGAIFIRSTQTGDLIQKFGYQDSNHSREDQFKSITISPDNKHLVAIDSYVEISNKQRYNEIKWFDIQSGELNQTWKLDYNPLPQENQSNQDLQNLRIRLCKLLFSPDGTRCVIDNSIEKKVWDVKQGIEIPGISLGTNLCTLQTISPDNRFAILSTNNLELWDIQSGKCVTTIFKTDENRRFIPNCVAYSEEGDWLVCGDYTGEVNIIDIPSKKVLYTWNYPETSLRFLRLSPDRSKLLIGTTNGVRIRDIPETEKE